MGHPKNYVIAQIMRFPKCKPTIFSFFFIPLTSPVPRWLHSFIWVKYVLRGVVGIGNRQRIYFSIFEVNWWDHYYWPPRWLITLREKPAVPRMWNTILVQNMCCELLLKLIFDKQYIWYWFNQEIVSWFLLEKLWERFPASETKQKCNVLELLVNLLQYSNALLDV